MDSNGHNEAMMRLLLRNSALSLLTLVLGLSAMRGIAQSELSPRDAEALAQASLIYIATVRRDGTQSRAAPVWFTTTPNRQVLIQTAATSWKAKRIRRGSPVMVWIGGRNGPAFAAKAEITNEPAVINRIVTDYPKKYLLARIGLHRPTTERFEQQQIVAIKITPVRDLPEGFASAPGTPPPNLNQGASNHPGLSERE
jgi:general stress protein 26